MERMKEYIAKEKIIEWFRPYGQTDEPIPYETLVSDLREMPSDIGLYTAKDLDYFYKISLRLIDKFRDQLNEEYGTKIEDAIKMFDTLYKEQNDKMPLLWYEYCCCNGGKSE